MRFRFFLAVLLCCTTVAAQPFRDPRLDREARITDLIARLTIEEKANLLMHYSPAVDRLGLHQFQWWGEALHGVGFSGFATVFFFFSWFFFCFCHFFFF